MIELFPNISDNFRRETDIILQMALSTTNLVKSQQIITKFSNQCNPEEKEYINFRLNVEVQKRRNEESVSNKRKE